LKKSSNPSVLIMVISAGIDPWLEIEKSGQEALFRNNTVSLKDYVWISGDPNFLLSTRHRFLIGLAKLRLYHFPDSRRFLTVCRKLLVSLLKWLPARPLMRGLLTSPTSKQLGTVEGNRVIQPLPTSAFISGCRALRAFEWALENSDFDYLVRVTSTCLVNEPSLLKFIENLPEDRVFAGQKMNHLGVSRIFMSGAAFVMSRDVVAGVVANQHRYQFDVYEDVDLGRTVREFDLADWIQMDRLDLQTISAAEMIPLDELENASVIRCKAESITSSPEPVLRIFEVVAHRLGWDQSGFRPI
jgi:hypothetical protein